MKLVSALGVLLSCAAARADIQYTSEMILTAATAESPKTLTMRAVKPKFERTETIQKFGPVETKAITIRECGKKQTIQLAPELKIYSVVPDYDEAAPAEAGSTPGADKPATGKMVITYAVQDLGEATVMNFKARRFMIETETQSSGCAGEGTSTVKMEMWVSDIRDANPCPDDHSPSSMSQAMSRSDCKIEVVTKGDFDKYAKIMRGLILRQKMYNGDTPMMTMEVISLSQAKLGDELFAIPADFKKVSLEEFQTAQTEAITKAMQAGIRIEPDDQ